MRLLVLTQKVDQEDENLGFFHRWLEEFSKYADLTVVANGTWRMELPANVRVYSLGKEKRAWRVVRLLRYWLFLLRNWRQVDAVFFHMIPGFVLASSPFLLFARRPSVLWYVHKSVTPSLRWAERLVDFICTASELSFRLPSKKVIYTGHAVDTENFKPASYNLQPATLRLLTVGRIAPVKDLETLIRACKVLKDTWDRQWILSVVGGPLMPRDQEYLTSVKDMINDYSLNEHVHFYGPRPYTEIADIYREHDVFISTSTTGSLDKSVLEAMASSLTVITANEAFQQLLPTPYFLEDRNSELLAARIKMLADESRPNLTLRNLILEKHSLQKTVRSILDVYSKL